MATSRCPDPGATMNAPATEAVGAGVIICHSFLFSVAMLLLVGIMFSYTMLLMLDKTATVF